MYFNSSIAIWINIVSQPNVYILAQISRRISVCHLIWKESQDNIGLDGARRRLKKKEKYIFTISKIANTVNPQKRPAGLILSLRVQMRVLLEFCLNSWIFVYCFLSFLRVLLECGSYSRAGLFRGFTLFFYVSYFCACYMPSGTGGTTGTSSGGF